MDTDAVNYLAQRIEDALEGDVGHNEAIPALVVVLKTWIDTTDDPVYCTLGIIEDLCLLQKLSIFRPDGNYLDQDGIRRKYTHPDRN